ncbi:NADH-quinone oxidoreductase, E subunit [Candidatus Endolissoclinum faulkneri L2]|uniref:NADH-quinone oxidoreductase, E subunit n=1 Tax=Candidatus Endolissoclinum faulkneri L2 TaxID=1193729 RepID=K7YGU1_9PROT|nr:NAD(P)H-dependent oxidoreductase subunit E [Candidatus Endolissoclinum faulkneri]AFX98790.1 NADH-quinone oxidoreductase, E subunit [Candidatus Endolissoclinum faulkneri L2]
MTIKEIADDNLQPKSFEWTDESQLMIDNTLKQYPVGRQASAVIPLLNIAQRQNSNWLPIKAIELIADTLDMPRIRVLEVATFYTMFNLIPVGKWFLQPCTTTPCWLRGSHEVMSCIKDKLGLFEDYATTSDGQFTLLEVECLGVCANAPVLQINDNVYEDLNYDLTAKLIQNLKNGERPKYGSMSNRQGSMPKDGPTSLISLKKSDGVPAWWAKKKPAAKG